MVQVQSVADSPHPQGQIVFGFSITGIVWALTWLEASKPEEISLSNNSLTMPTSTSIGIPSTKRYHIMSSRSGQVWPGLVFYEGIYLLFLHMDTKLIFDIGFRVRILLHLYRIKKGIAGLRKFKYIFRPMTGDIDRYRLFQEDKLDREGIYL